MSETPRDNRTNASVDSGATAKIVAASLAARRRSGFRSRLTGMIAILLGVSFLVIIFASIFATASTAFQQTFIRLTITLDPADVDPLGDASADSLAQGPYRTLVRDAIMERIGSTERRDRRKALQLLTTGARFDLRDYVIANPDLVGQTIDYWATADSDVDQTIKGNLPRTGPESRRQLDDQQIAWLDRLEAQGDVQMRFNWPLFLNGDSPYPELAGLAVALVGSLLVMAIVAAVSVPLGVATAVYLEEFAPKNRWTDLIEVNVNNLAAVPSIVFGILGAALFINFLGLYRSSALVGGLVLSLMTLPVVIIATRAALRAVPPSIREGALGIGASPLQVTFHHVLPLALPGILTGSIIGLARALGETAPLLLVGLAVSVSDMPTNIDQSSVSVLPSQIYQWAQKSDRGFVERTSATIVILLAFMVVMNLTAIYLRRRFERRW